MRITLGHSVVRTEGLPKPTMLCRPTTEARARGYLKTLHGIRHQCITAEVTADDIDEI